MNAIIEYIQRFILDNQSNQKKLANILLLKTLVNELENKVRAEMSIEELKEISQHQPTSLIESLRRIRDNNIQRYGSFGSQVW
jgi:predicted transposase YbfD/YdcC